MGILPIYIGMFSITIWKTTIMHLRQFTTFTVLKIVLHQPKISTIICSSDAQVFEMIAIYFICLWIMGAEMS